MLVSSSQDVSICLLCADLSLLEILQIRLYDFLTKSLSSPSFAEIKLNSDQAPMKLSAWDMWVQELANLKETGSRKNFNEKWLMIQRYLCEI